MASILKEYLNRKWGVLDYQSELQRLVGEYNKHTGRYMFIYAGGIAKARTKGVDVSLVQDDFYNIQDILRELSQKKIDFFIETPGGSGEAAEEIARFLRNKFDEVNFVIAGEAKSAGTILALSGDNIYMTETGSLGPIDAQMRIGRSVVSAHDYKAWVDDKKEEAARNGCLNPFDAIVIAQISPGELYGVVNMLEFAKDLVKEWLEKYKFKNWTETETQKKAVTPEMRKARANEVADLLCNHTEWRTHGRSLKMEDLRELLLIGRIDDDPKLADIVYRIKAMLMLIFSSSTIYKVFLTEDLKLFNTYAVNPNTNVAPTGVPRPPMAQAGRTPLLEQVDIGIDCPKCGKNHHVYGYVGIDSAKILQLKLKVNPNVKDNDILICDQCQFAIDLKPIKSNIETQSRKKLTFK